MAKKSTTTSLIGFDPAEVAQEYARKFLGRHKITVGVVVGVFVASLISAYQFHWPMGVVLLLAILAVPAKRMVHTQIWIKGYRRSRAKESLGYPGRSEALTFRKTMARRRKELVEQWAAACSSYDLVNSIKMTPGLNELGYDVRGNFTAVIRPGKMAIKGGVGKFQAHASLIAEIVHCEQITVRPFGDKGNARVTFYYDRPLKDLLPIQQLPESAEDEISLGRDIEGSLAAIAMGLSVLIIGMTGMGKSNALWTILVSLQTKVHTMLYMADPKGGQELGAWRQWVGKVLGRMQVMAWERDIGSEAKNTGNRAAAVTGISKMILAVEAAMKDRAKQLADLGGNRKWTPAMSETYPLIVLVVDEALELMVKMSTPVRNALMTILSQGRANGVQVILLSQLAEKEVLDKNRTLTRIKVVFGTDDPIQTGMAFGDMQAEANGALCSQIDEPGIAYIKEEGVRGYKQIRVAYVSDDDVDQMMLTGLPADMGKDVTQAEAWQPTWNYRYFTRDGELLYTGITNDCVARDKQHWADFKNGDRKHAWMQYVDTSRPPLRTWAPSKIKAKEIETIEIRCYGPLGNWMENHDNPYRGMAPAGVPKGFVMGSSLRAKIHRPKKTETSVWSHYDDVVEGEVIEPAIDTTPTVLAEKVEIKPYPVTQARELAVHRNGHAPDWMGGE